MATTTPIQAKKQALAKAAATTPAKKATTKSKATTKPKAATKKLFPDSNGVDIRKGVTVTFEGKRIGTAAYRVMDGKRHVPRIGVALTGKATATVNGRTVKNRCYDADTLTVVPE